MCNDEAEALVKMRENPGEYTAMILNRAPAEVSWYNLNFLAGQDPKKSLELWEEIKAAAVEELRIGFRAGKAVEAPSEQCWGRARFLALQTDLMQAWQPANGMERQLIDAMAQAQTGFFFWLERLTTWSTLERITEEKLKEKGRWDAPQVQTAEAIEQAATMVERFNKIFLRTLRALQDMRRNKQGVVVKNAGQVNFAAQQVNLNQ